MLLGGIGIKAVSLPFNNIKITYMIKNALMIGLAAMPMSVLAQDDRLDSVLRQLPSSLEYFTPNTAPDSTLPLPSKRNTTIIDYLSQGVALAEAKPSLFLSGLHLPAVVRPVQAPIDISFRLDSIQLFAQPQTYRITSVERLLEDYRQRRLLDEYTTQALQARSFAYAEFTSSQLERSAERMTQSSQTVDAQTMLGNDIHPGSIKRYNDQFVVAEIERKHWQPRFESSIQFSQNHISDNWHKGGSSNLNLSMRNYFALVYNRDRVQWLNELESKLGLYTTDQSDDSKRYRINEDLLRLHSNYGIKINKRWSYTLDGELRTQLFRTYNAQQTRLQSAPWSPIRTNLGLGMQYSYSTRSNARYGRRFSASLNLAPFSHNWRWSGRDDIDLSRHGLKPEQMSIHTFGSTLRGQLQWDFNMDVTWTSRVYFNTSYTSVEAEWENTLTLRISRFFSTRINLQLRYDDAAKPSEGWNKYLQFNEMISFGFNYKL